MNKTREVKMISAYVYISIGITIGLITGLIAMPKTEIIKTNNNDLKIEVGKSSGDVVQPTSISADQIGSAILWNQQGASGNGVQSVTGLDQIIGNSEINIK